MYLLSKMVVFRCYVSLPKLAFNKPCRDLTRPRHLLVPLFETRRTAWGLRFAYKATWMKLSKGRTNAPSDRSPERFVNDGIGSLRSRNLVVTNNSFGYDLVKVWYVAKSLVFFGDIMKYTLLTWFAQKRIRLHKKCRPWCLQWISGIGSRKLPYDFQVSCSTKNHHAVFFELFANPGTDVREVVELYKFFVRKRYLYG